MKSILAIAIATSLTSHLVFARPSGGHGGHAPGFEQGGKVNENFCQAIVNSAEHQARVNQTLAYFDLNHDDQITQDEVQATHLARFKEIDTDGNGFLSFEEFQNGANTAQDSTTTTDSERSSRRGRGRHELNGYVPDTTNSANSWMVRFQQMYFNRLDNNSDGQISPDEFMVNLPVFDRFDSNEDGVVTKDDLLQGPCQQPSTSTPDTTTVVTEPTPTVTTTEPVPEESTVVTEPTETSTTPVAPSNDHSGGAACSTCH
jgi:Ca2+-binding EF-hand superfamily protein